MKRLLLGLSTLFILLFVGCETKASRCAEEETNRCIADELNKIKKPFDEETITNIRNECGTYVNEMMNDMRS